MKDGIYNLIVSVLDLFLWDGRLVGEENLPTRGPAIFIANHHEALGPISVVCAIPLRFYFWVVANMVDPDLAAPYLQWDFVERTLHLQPPFSAWVARHLSKITVPLLRSLGSIPVYKQDYPRMAETLRQSMDILNQGKFLLVFPEDNLAPRDPATAMGPFQHTFVRLGETFYAETGRRLDFYPLTIHPKGLVIVGKPVAFDPLVSVGFERHRLKNSLENTIHATYLQVGNDPEENIPLLTPQHK